MGQLLEITWCERRAIAGPHNQWCIFVPGHHGESTARTCDVIRTAHVRTCGRIAGNQRFYAVRLARPVRCGHVQNTRTAGDDQLLPGRTSRSGQDSDRGVRNRAAQRGHAGAATAEAKTTATATDEADELPRHHRATRTPRRLDFERFLLFFVAGTPTASHNGSW